MDINNPAHWEELLVQLCKPDTAIVREATEVIQQCMKHPSSFLMLFQLINSSSLLEVQHLSAILCRRSVFKYWDATPDNYKDDVKRISFDIITKPDVPRMIKKSVADIIAQVVIASKQWPGFTDFLLKLVQSSEASHREMGVYLFGVILDSDDLRDTFLASNTQMVLGVIQNGLRDGDEEVRIRSLDCACSFLTGMNSHIKEFLSLLPSIIDVINYCIDESDNRMSVGFEILNSLTEDYMDYLKPMVADLLRFTITVGAKSSLDISMRQHALYFIEFIIGSKPKSFLENANLNDVIDLCFFLMIEPEDDEESASVYGSKIVDVLAINIPSKFIWQPIMERVVKYIQSPDVLHRKAAITIISVISEGCGDKVEENITDIMPWILAGFKDESSVREASFIAISEFSKHLSESISAYNDAIIPILLEGTRDSKEIIIVKSFYAISHYMTCEPELLLPYLDTLMNHVMTGLNHPSVEVKELAINSLSSSIAMANEAFEPYFQQTISIMKEWMAITDPNLIIIRGRATECVSMLAVSLGKELFNPHFTDVVNIAMNGLETVDDAELREFIYRFFGLLARNYAEELSPYYNALIPYLLGSCESSEGLVCENEDESFNILPEEALETKNINQRITLKVLSSYMDEKAAAVSCLGWLVAENGEAASSYIEASFNVLANLTRFDLYPPVAISAITGVVQIVAGMLRFLDERFIWQKGQISSLPDAVAKAINMIYIEYKKVYELPEQTMVRSVIQAAGKMSLLFGPISVMEHMTTIVDWIKKVLCHQAEYQLHQESFDENEEDFETFTVVMDAVVELSKACGKLFVPFLPEIINCFAPYVQDEAPPEYLECTLSTLAEIADEIENDFEPYAQAFIPICMKALRPDFEGIQYVCLCLRKIILYGPELPADAIKSIWETINQLMNQNPSNDQEFNIFDCLFGLISQILLKYHNIVPVDQVIITLINYLPLHVNPEPATVVYQCITTFSNRPAIVPSLPTLKTLLMSEIQDGDITEETRLHLNQFLHS